MKSSRGGEVYAFSGMLGHMSMLREFCGHFSDLFPGMVGFEDCESPFARLRNNEVGAERFLVRRFCATQQPFELKELDNAYWIPGFENPADGLTKLKGDLAPLSRLLESGSYKPGT